MREANTLLHISYNKFRTRCENGEYTWELRLHQKLGKDVGLNPERNMMYAYANPP